MSRYIRGPVIDVTTGAVVCLAQDIGDGDEQPDVAAPINAADAREEAIRDDVEGLVVAGVLRPDQRAEVRALLDHMDDEHHGLLFEILGGDGALRGEAPPCPGR